MKRAAFSVQCTENTLCTHFTMYSLASLLVTVINLGTGFEILALESAKY